MPPDLAAEILARIVATAAIVIGITLAVDRLGPTIGGAIAGLPITIGPGFFFMLREHGTAFSAGAAAASLVALVATQSFLTGYVASAQRSYAAIVPATLSWFAAALILSYVPPSPWNGLTLFTAATVAARWIGHHFLRPHPPARIKGGLALLLARGVAAGVIVAVATLAADRLGAVWSGFLMSYPIGFTMVSVTLHQRAGADTTIATLHAAMLGVTSLAAFTFTLAVTAMLLGPIEAFAASLAASGGVTVALTWRASRAG